MAANGTRLSYFEIIRAKRLYSKGRTLAQIAEVMDRSMSSVHRAVHRPLTTYECEQYWVPTPEEIEASCAEVRKGWSNETYEERARPELRRVPWTSPEVTVHLED